MLKKQKKLLFSLEKKFLLNPKLQIKNSNCLITLKTLTNETYLSKALLKYLFLK